MTTITLAKIGNNKTLNYAIDELARCLKAIDGRLLIDQRTYGEYDPSITNVLWVGRADRIAYSRFDDEILIDVKDGAGIITGANERAVLIAAYRFLRALGCAWVRPGADGEIIPKKPLGVEDFTVSIHESPSYRHRGIVVEGALNYEHIFNMVEWMPRVGLNEYYVQFFTPFPFFNRWYSHEHNPFLSPEPIALEDAHRIKARFDEEIIKRGLLYFAVGHGFTALAFGLDASFDDENSPLLTPELRQCFAMIDGKRKFRGGINSTQLCYSNPKVKRLMAQAVVKYCKENPYIDVLCISLADGVNNFCECDECTKLRPSDWYVEILNEMDRQLTEAGLDVILQYEAYVDLMWAPIKARLNNPERFIFQFAPITRTYSAAFVDTPMEENVQIPPFVTNKVKLPRELGLNMALLDEWRELVKCESQIFDYHLMWDHFLDPGYTSCAKTLHRDVTTLDQLGFAGYLSCQEMRQALPTALPMYAMARGLWDKNSRFEDISREYYADMFGENGPAVEAYLAKISELFDAKFMRNENPAALKTATARMDAVDALVDEFKSTHIDAKKDSNASWKYLWYHADICKMYAELIRRYSLGDELKIKEQTKAFTEFHFSLEPEIHTVFDNCLFDEVYQRWIKRVYSNRATDAVDL